MPESLMPVVLPSSEIGVGLSSNHPRVANNIFNDVLTEYTATAFTDQTPTDRAVGHVVYPENPLPILPSADVILGTLPANTPRMDQRTDTTRLAAPVRQVAFNLSSVRNTGDLPVMSAYAADTLSTPSFVPDAHPLPHQIDALASLRAGPQDQPTGLHMIPLQQRATADRTSPASAGLISARRNDVTEMISEENPRDGVKFRDYPMGSEEIRSGTMMPVAMISVPLASQATQAPAIIQPRHEEPETPSQILTPIKTGGAMPGQRFVTSQPAMTERAFTGSALAIPSQTIFDGKDMHRPVSVLSKGNGHDGMPDDTTAGRFNSVGSHEAPSPITQPGPMSKIMMPARPETDTARPELLARPSQEKNSADESPDRDEMINAPLQAQTPAETAPAAREAKPNMDANISVTSTISQVSEGQRPHLAPPAHLGSARAESHAVDITRDLAPIRQLAPALMALQTAPDGTRHMALRLHPEHLGEVRVEITRADATPVRVEITAARTETLVLLRDDMPALHHALDAAGIPASNRELVFQLATPAPPIGHSGASAMQNPADESGRRGGTGEQPQSAHHAAGGETETGDLTEAMPRHWRRTGLDITA